MTFKEHQPKISTLIIIPGGLGSGVDGVSIPIIEDFVTAMSLRCDVTVISLCRVHPVFRPSNYKLYDLDIEHSAHIFIKLFKFYKWVKGDMSDQHWDIIHGIWTFPAACLGVMLGKARNVPSVVGLQGGCMADLKIGTLVYGGNRGWFKKRVNKWTLKNASVITAETQFQKDLIRDNDLKDGVEVIYSGRSHQGVLGAKTLGREIKFIHVANLTPIKDQTTLLDTFAIINQQIPCTLTIIGPDYDDGAVQRYCDNLGLEKDVSFKGYLSNDSVVRALKNHDMMIHTSLFEGGALAIIEAMLYGVVVAGTKVGLVSDLSDDFFIRSERQDSEDLAQKILTVIKDHTRYNALRDNAYQWAASHSIDSMADSFLHLYNRQL